MKTIVSYFSACCDFAMLLIFAIIAAGCSSIGAAPAQSISEQLAYGYGTVASVRTTCTQQLQTQAITVTQARRCLDDTDTARAGLDAAFAASASGDQTTAVAKLAAASSILTSLQTYLQTKGK